MTTLAEIAAEIDTQVYELAAFLDLGTDYDEHEELEEDVVRDIWEIITDCWAHNFPL